MLVSDEEASIQRRDSQLEELQNKYCDLLDSHSHLEEQLAQVMENHPDQGQQPQHTRWCDEEYEDLGEQQAQDPPPSQKAGETPQLTTANIQHYDLTPRQRTKSTTPRTKVPQLDFSHIKYNKEADACVFNPWPTPPKFRGWNYFI